MGREVGHPAHRSQQIGDGTGMLACQHLRRGHDRRLMPGLDRHQACVQCDKRLPRADIPLEQHVHRLRGSHLPPDVFHRLVLSPRGFERERRLQCTSELTVGFVSEPGALRGQTLPPERHAKLQHEQLVELQAFPRARKLVLVGGEMDPSAGRVPVAQRFGRVHVGRKWIRLRWQLLQRPPDQLTDGLGADPFGRWMYRGDPGRMHEILSVPPKDLDLLVRELQAPPVELGDT